MQKVINCSCGYVVRAENDEKLVAKAQDHGAPSPIRAIPPPAKNS